MLNHRQSSILGSTIGEKLTHKTNNYKSMKSAIMSTSKPGPALCAPFFLAPKAGCLTISGQRGPPLLWSASFRPRGGAIKFVRADRRAFSPRRRSNRSIRFARRRSCRRMRCNRMKARANRGKSASVNFSRRLCRRTTTKKYRSARKGRRSFDTAIEYGTVAIIAMVT